MTKDEIIRMARAAAAKRGHTFREVPQVETVEFLEAFFLMASEVEREACAKVCEASINDYQYPTMTVLAAAIRARGKHD